MAAAVGVGSTALYHYFESKLHCLYEIMAETLRADREIRAGHARSTRTSRTAFPARAATANYDLNEREVMRNRVLVSEQSLVACTGRLRVRRRPASSRS